MNSHPVNTSNCDYIYTSNKMIWAIIYGNLYICIYRIRLVYNSFLPVNYEFHELLNSYELAAKIDEFSMKVNIHRLKFSLLMGFELRCMNLYKKLMNLP